MTRSRQLPSWLSWQSAALELQDREVDSHPKHWSCIFRNWSQLSVVKILYGIKLHLLLHTTTI